MPIVVEYEGLSFPSLGIGKPATISITGWNSSGSTSLFKDAFKVPNLPTFTPTYFPSATKRSSSSSSNFGLKDFLGNLWKKGIAPALTLGLSYATQRAILKAAGVKHPEIIIAKELGLPLLSSFPETTPKTVVYTPQPPPPPPPTHTTIAVRQPPPPPPPPARPTTPPIEGETTIKERLPNPPIPHRMTQAKSEAKHDTLSELFKNKQLMYLAGLLLLVLLLRR